LSEAFSLDPVSLDDTDDTIEADDGSVDSRLLALDPGAARAIEVDGVTIGPRPRIVPPVRLTPQVPVSSASVAQDLETEGLDETDPITWTRGDPAPIRRDAVFRRLLALADLLAAGTGLLVTDLISGRAMTAVTVAALPLIIVIAKMSGRYDHDEVVLRKSTLDEIPPLMMLAASFALIWSVVAYAAGVRLHSGGAGTAVLWGATGIALIFWRATARAFGQLRAPVERVLIVGSATARMQLAHSLSSDPSTRVEIAGFLPLEDERRRHSGWGVRDCRRRRALRFADIGTVVRELDVHRVFLLPTSADSETLLDAVSVTTALGVKVSIVPRLFEVVGSSVEFDTVGGVTVLGVRRPGLTRSSRTVKRAMDAVGAGLGLIALAPFGAIVALAIKLDSHGPVFFRQTRVGRDGRVFRIVKFRSMVDGAEAQRAALEARNESRGTFKLSADPRITRVGKLLRRTSLDELPQLINVLLGDMSLVGPRPLVVDEDRLVEGRHRGRSQLAPGMTGPWQVLGPTRPPLSEMVKTDYLYAANWSLWSDVKILLRTFAHISRLRGV
jgi:exopolysaccharide biosynthesis polyprenyl glycosylphosphotransferase